MRPFGCLLLFLALASAACQSVSPQTAAFLRGSPQKQKASLAEFTLPEQASGDCAPASLYAIFKWFGEESSLAALRAKLIAPTKNGALPASVLSTVRHKGFLGVTIRDLTSVTQEVAAGLPVMALLNMGFRWSPVWHYVVVIGFDRDEQTVTVYDGSAERSHMPMTYFERHWELADYWAAVITPPGKLSASASELEQMHAASSLEAMDHLEAASLSYRAILNKWPDSLSAQIGLANVAVAEDRFSEAEKILESAIKEHADSEVVRHNLRIVKQLREQRKAD